LPPWQVKQYCRNVAADSGTAGGAPSAGPNAPAKVNTTIPIANGAWVAVLMRVALPLFYVYFGASGAPKVTET
jgi:hypothetical protein